MLYKGDYRFDDEGKAYWLDCSILGYPGIDIMQGDMGASDMTMLNLRTDAERGEIVQSCESIYKIARFLQGVATQSCNFLGSATTSTY